jgi:hypothetical protein
MVRRWLAISPIVLISAAISTPTQTQWQPLGRVTPIVSSANGLEAQVGEAQVRVMSLSWSVIRVRYAPRGNALRLSTPEMSADATTPAGT